MSERALRLAAAAFMILASAVLVNLLVLQPSRPGSNVFATNRSPFNAAIETSALRPGETDEALIAAAAPTAIVTVKAPITTGPSRQAPPVSLSDAAETVRAVQRELKARTYEPGAIDGVAGLMTEAAVMAYEADHGLPLTADPSEDLLRALLFGSDAPTTAVRPAKAQSARASEVIRSVQLQLHKLGYEPGKPDGQLGESTISAIRRFEKQNGLADSGRISGQLVARLTTLAGRGRVADGR